MQKFLSIVLSLFLLVSSAGLTYGQHFCGGKVVADALMFGEKQLSCTGLMSPAYENQNEKPPCCENVYHQVQTDDDFLTSSFQIDILPQFVVAFVEVFVLQTVEIKSSKEITFSEYLPPPLERDIPVLFQTFLI